MTPFDPQWFQTLLGDWILPNTVTAGCLALLVAGLCRWRRFAPAVTHAIWLVVLIKLITPTLIEVPLPIALGRPGVLTDDGARGPSVATEPDTVVGATNRETVELVSSEPSVDFESTGETPIAPPSFSALGDDAAAAASTFASLSAKAAGPAGASSSSNERSARGIGASLAETVASLASSIGEGWKGLFFPVWLAYLWGAATAVVLAIQLRRVVQLRRMIARAVPAEPELAALVRQAAGDLGVSAIPVHIVPGLCSPALCAWGRASLLWPEGILDHLSPSGRRAVVLHELAHLVRRDHWVGWLELVAECGWWWNPLYWHVRRQLRESAELACDAWVVALLPDGRRAYADALIDVAQGPISAPLSGIVLGIGDGSRKLLERRLIMIMRERMRYRIPAIGMVLIGLVALLTTLPRWSPIVLGATDEPLRQDYVDTPSISPGVPTRLVGVSDDVPVVFPSSGGPQPILAQGAPVAPGGTPAAAPGAGSGVLPNPPMAPGAVPPAAAPEIGPPALSGRAPEAGSEARLERLEAQLAALLAEVQNLRGARTPGVRPRIVYDQPGGEARVVHEVVGPIAAPAALPAAAAVPADAAPKGPSSYTPLVPPVGRSRPAAPARAAPPKGAIEPASVQPESPSTPRLGARSKPVAAGDTVSLTRSTYRLPPGRAEIVARFLQEQLSDEIEVKVKGDALQVTASADDQNAVAVLITLLSKKGKPQPSERSRPGASSFVPTDPNDSQS